MASKFAAQAAKATKRPDKDLRYVNRVRGAGVKLWLDGSPPTALMTLPYFNEEQPSDKQYKGVAVGAATSSTRVLQGVGGLTGM